MAKKPAAAVKSYIALRPVRLDGAFVPVGSPVDLPEDEGAALAARGVVKDAPPNEAASTKEPPKTA